MSLFVFNPYVGKPYLKLEKGCPYYVTGTKNHKTDCLLKCIFKNIFGYSLSIRCDNADEFNDKIKEKLLRVFDAINGTKAMYHDNVYYLDDMKWILKNVTDFEPTVNPQVMYNMRNKKYYGFSHRGVVSFGIGDTLFDIEETDKTITKYCQNRKYRRRFIKALIEYELHNNSFMFSDLVKNGIKSVVPYRKRGNKIIENNNEAFEAAANFAKYIS